MEMFVVLGVLAFAIYLLYGYFKANKDNNRITITDDIFSARGVTVNFKQGTIQVEKHVYPVSMVTGIKSVLEPPLGNHVQIDVDDLRNPVHRVRVIDAPKFASQLSVAIRKAGGTSFV
jgi:hypothetical protein